jgi:hypothetical protein
MKDIKQAIYSTLEEDAQIRQLTGHSQEDPRLYYIYPPVHIELTEDTPAYITYYELFSSAPFLTREEEVYSIDIWSREMSRNEDIYNRIDQLLNHKVILFTSHHNLAIVRESKRDLFEETSGIHHKVIQYRIISIPKE